MDAGLEFYRVDDTACQPCINVVVIKLLCAFIISNIIFALQAIFSTVYIGKPRVNRITMISGFSIIYRYYKLHLHFDIVWIVM